MRPEGAMSGRGNASLQGDEAMNDDSRNSVPTDHHEPLIGWFMLISQKIIIF